jgi:hypothetical protein
MPTIVSGAEPTFRRETERLVVLLELDDSPSRAWWEIFKAMAESDGRGFEECSSGHHVAVVGAPIELDASDEGVGATLDGVMNLVKEVDAEHGRREAALTRLENAASSWAAALPNTERASES